MNITFNNNKLRDVILIPSNDFLQNKIVKDNDFNICSVINTSLEVRDLLLLLLLKLKKLNKFNKDLLYV